MFEIIESIIDQYYDYRRPDIRDLSLLYSSPDLGIVTVRWKTISGQVTVKSMEIDGKRILTKLD